MTYKQAGGWFSNVNGAKVNKTPYTHGATYYTKGYPQGVLWHYTVGCEADIKGVYTAQGYPGAPFCVGRDGSIRQYVPMDTAGWHAYEASHVYMGIEHEAYPGNCELTTVQLENSAKLSAAIVDYTKKAHGYSIPVKHLTDAQAAAMDPGFLDHRQGPISGWNKDGHTDHLYDWTWDQYIAAVQSHLGSSSGGGFLAGLKDSEQQEILAASRSLNAVVSGLRTALSLAGAGSLELFGKGLGNLLTKLGYTTPKN